MTTVSAAKRIQFFKRLIWFIVFVFVLLLVRFLFSPTVGAILEQLTPPVLPRITKMENRVWLDQNWDEEISSKFHHISQGSHMLFVPLPWLMALEQPAGSVFTIPLGDRGRFTDNDYILRFGFIEDEVTEFNPHGLPIGFAATPFQQLPGLGRQETAVGFTCAACHTAHLTHNNTEYVINGGPAAVDFLQLEKAMSAALGQTLVSAKVPFLGARFKRFARNLLGDDGYSELNVSILEEELESIVNYVSSLPKEVETVEGYSRLDALNRIGNTVFAWNANRFENYQPPNAPVTFPHIWTASWFDWVQYDASIMGPLIRNAGEAMGLEAYFDITAPPGEQRFSSSINLDNMWWIEQALKGDSAPFPNRQFSGLLAPPWPDDFAEINEERAAAGKEIYNDICVHCHLPPLNSDEIWTDEFFSPITYIENSIEKQTPEQVLKLNKISLQRVGTDPARANVFIERKVSTSSIDSDDPDKKIDAMGIDAEVCTRNPALPFSPYNVPNYSEIEPTELVNVSISDGPSISFALALGGIVQQVADQWFKQNYISDEDKLVYTENRPNCLQAGQFYKSRPLNGIWATAPFLHNGAIPTIYDLLSPPDERPEFVQLGSIEFDEEKVGIKQDPKFRHRRGQKYNGNGLFILDTSLPGNSNRGHEFSDEWDPTLGRHEQKQGVHGPKFTPEERLAIIEYLKTL